MPIGRKRYINNVNVYNYSLLYLNNQNLKARRNSD